MDYKDTLNLPRTDFPMKADLVSREPERLKRWESARLYQRILAQRADAERFVLHDGPPFANGDVHIGNGLNKILKDIIVKYKTLRGFNAPYIPGWDCHGLPIEFKVAQEMRKSHKPEPGSPAGPDSHSPAELRKACEAYALKYVDIQRQQFKRLGIFGDWEAPYLTLDKRYEADELRLFADIVEQGFVYRGKKPVYWCIPCRTALAEAEIEYKDHVSPSIYVKFPVAGRPNTFVLIWTTTPWTLPANLAVAYNSTFQYVRVGVGAEDYILFRGLLPAVAAKCGWVDYREQPFDVAQLAAMEYRHPFCNRTGRFHAGDSFVTSDTGTGFVHIAPGHGQEDYQLGLRAGLPVYSPIDDEGRFVVTNDLPAEQQMPAGMIGKTVFEKHGKSEANEAVLQELRARHALAHQEDFLHSYPFCWRSKTPVIFRGMDQWFISIDHALDGAGRLAAARPAEGSQSAASPAKTFRQRAFEEIDRAQWIPDWGVNRIKGAVQSRPDWCISRQRTWGVPIPAFFDAGGNPILDAGIVRRAAGLFENRGSNAWFEMTSDELWGLLRPGDWKGPEAASKSLDTLDVWIDSGSSSRAVLMQRPELRSGPRGSNSPFSWQADMYLEGSDQHRGWFQSSLLLSLAGNGAAPYKTVLTHGFMVDADREKISKSKQGQGAYEKPQTADTYVKKWGADIVRLWVSSQDFRNDIVVSEERIGTVAETYRVIRNALRYQLSNLYDFDPAKHSVPNERLTGLDRWLLWEFSKLEQDVIAAYDRYEFHVAYQRLSQFVAVELSSIYHDVIKDRLYTDAPGSPRRRSTQTVLHRLVTALCGMLAPVLSFTAEEAWEFVPGHGERSIHESQWGPAGFSPLPSEIEKWNWLKDWRARVLPELEKARQSKTIGKALEAGVELRVPPDELPLSDAESLRELVNVSVLKITAGESASVSVTRAGGRKCERCWHWETDVGSDPQHPAICGRCVAAVKVSAREGSGNAAT